jgi:hypothetical protein
MSELETVDIPKYRKKREKKTPVKSKHKHDYIECIGKKTIGGRIIYVPADKCTICGKTVWTKPFFSKKIGEHLSRIMTKLEDIQKEYPEYEVVEL